MSSTTLFVAASGDEENASASATPLQDIDDLARANSGDSAAIQRYFEHNLALLAAMSRRISGADGDPEELLSRAVLAVVTKWREGTGPTSHANAYVIQVMRNLVKDEARSPRSKVLGLGEHDEVISDDFEQVRRIDLTHDLALVSIALRSLARDQQRVLLECVVNGRKPGELEEELSRPASAIYSLLRRSKHALGRATLRASLEEEAPERCRKAAARLPTTISPVLDETDDSTGMLHIRTCARCRAAWLRFGALASALGVTPVLTLGQLTIAPASSAVAAGLASTGVGLSGANTAGALDVAPAATESSAVARPETNGGVQHNRRLMTALLSAGAFLLVVSIVVFVRLLSSTGNLSVVPLTAADGTRSLDVELSMSEPWTDTVLEFTVPEGMAIVQAPSGWSCGTFGTVIRCETPQSAPAGGRFVFAGDPVGTPESIGFTVSFSAESEERTVMGNAGATFPR